MTWNPFLLMEEIDAERWNEICKERFEIAYKDYEESKKRLEKIKIRLGKGEGK